MAIQHQVVWEGVNVSANGKAAFFKRGEILPPPVSDAELNQRGILQLGGALNVVEVVYTPEELAAARTIETTAPDQAAAQAAATQETGSPVTQDPTPGPSAEEILDPAGLQRRGPGRPRKEPAAAPTTT